MDYYVELIYRYQGKGILIDTNLLLVYFIGSYDSSLISKFKCTLAFTLEDFYLLERVFNFFKRIVTTPNILTEVNSLANQLPQNIKLSYYTTMAQHISRLEEHYLTSIKLCSLDHFIKFGLADSAIIELVKGKYLVLTDDFRLANYLQTVNIDVINFNHIRAQNWGIFS
jgi:rRNA-processing protein FCF1